MALADRITIEGGFPGIELMENAGKAVVETIHARFADASSVLVVCGLGNNGGDGFVVAHLLATEGKNVRVWICGDLTRITGDAVLALARLEPGVLLTEMPDLNEFDLIVDALLGAGLDRDVTGEMADIIQAVNQSSGSVVSVDLPSGTDGRTGQIRGHAIEADCTATFFRLKPAHMLYPGRAACGTTDLYQIGIAEDVLRSTGIVGIRNTPHGWQHEFSCPAADGHKYHRGHALILSGPPHATGAGRLVAQAALRSGAGLVTLASPSDALAINASHLTSVMLCQADKPEDVEHILKDQRINCVALGPGMEPDNRTRKMVTSVLQSHRMAVLDAGALTTFCDAADRLFDMIKAAAGDVFLTPHDGEFIRLFPELDRQLSKIERAEAAAEMSGATIILKGADTIVAAPDGRTSVCDNAPPWLATAGSGDVLTGVVAGLTAQGMPAFDAASAAVWLHAEAANILGAGLISSDLDEGLRIAIRNLLESDGQHGQARLSR